MIKALKLSQPQLSQIQAEAKLIMLGLELCNASEPTNPTHPEKLLTAYIQSIPYPVPCCTAESLDTVQPTSH